jgi:hypothetical protein
MSGAPNSELDQKPADMQRRTKDEVLTELPAKRRVTVPIELADRKAYEKVKVSCG